MTSNEPPAARGSDNPDGRRGTAAGSVLRQLAGRFREGRAAIGDDVWRAWLRRVAIGFAGMFALMVVLRMAAAEALARGFLDWERDFLLWLGSGAAPLRFSSAVFVQTFGSDITLVILITLTAGIAGWARLPITSLSIILAFIVPDLVGRFGWAIWDRARPDLLYDGIASPGFHSFPSGHTSKTVAVYGLLTVMWIRASASMLEKLVACVMLGIIAVVVPVGRMAMGVHWPSDVVGGMVIGAAWLSVLAARPRKPALRSKSDVLAE